MSESQLPAAYPPSSAQPDQSLYQGPHPTSDPPPSQPQAHYSPSDAPPSYESQAQHPPPYPQASTSYKKDSIETQQPHHSPTPAPQQHESWRPPLTWRPPAAEVCPQQQGNWRPPVTSAPAEAYFWHQAGRPTIPLQVRARRREGDWTVASWSMLCSILTGCCLVSCMWTFPCTMIGMILAIQAYSQQHRMNANKLGACSIMCSTLSWITAFVGVGILAGLLVTLLPAPTGN